MRATLVLALGVAACSSSSTARDAVESDVVGDASVATDTTTDTGVDSVETTSDTSIETDVGLEVVEDATPDSSEPTTWAAGCKLEGDADTVPIPEASGALMLDATHVLLVADSGNGGQAIVFDLVAKHAIDLTLPLGTGAGDDLENLSRGPDGRIWSLTSAGFIRAWRAVESLSEHPSFELDVGPLLITDDDAWHCEPTGVNCGANFEGLCLDPAPALGACAGWAASKARGVLVCLVVDGAAFRLDPTRTITITTEADNLSDCAFEPIAPHRLVVAGNVFSGSTLWEVDPVAGTATPFADVGAPNQEAIAISSDGRIQSFGDLQELTPDSPHLALRCPLAGGGLASEP